MKKIDLYILREFLTTFIIVSIFFTLISLIVDVFENLNRFIDNEVSANILIDYYKASLPSMISVTIPVSCLVSSVFTYGMMIQRKEWLVFKSSGLSLYRLSTPVLLLGLLLSIGSFYFDNSIVIDNNKTKNEIKSTYMSKNKSRAKNKSVFENVYFQKKTLRFYFPPAHASPNCFLFFFADRIPRARAERVLHRRQSRAAVLPGLGGGEAERRALVCKKYTCCLRRSIMFLTRPRRFLSPLPTVA